MCHLRHRLRIFLFHRKITYHSPYIHVFLFFNIPWFTKSIMMSWWVLLHGTGCSFEYIFWTATHKVAKFGQIIEINHGKNFSGIFWTIWRTAAKLQVFFNLGIYSNYSVTSYVKIPKCFKFLERWIIDI